MRLFVIEQSELERAGISRLDVAVGVDDDGRVWIRPPVGEWRQLGFGGHRVLRLLRDAGVDPYAAPVIAA